MKLFFTSASFLLTILLIGSGHGLFWDYFIWPITNLISSSAAAPRLKLTCSALPNVGNVEVTITNCSLSISALLDKHEKVGQKGESRIHAHRHASISVDKELVEDPTKLNEAVEGVFKSVGLSKANVKTLFDETIKGLKEQIGQNKEPVNTGSTETASKPPANVIQKTVYDETGKPAITQIKSKDSTKPTTSTTQATTTSTSSTVGSLTSRRGKNG